MTCPGTLQVWAKPFEKLRAPKIFNLRTDPYERADVTSNTYYEWYLRHVFIIYPMLAGVNMFVETFREFPPVQHADSFAPDQALDSLRSMDSDH